MTGSQASQSRTATTHGTPVVCGHQGHSIEGHSNSLRAISSAAEYGARLVELDVRRCANDFVVFHDGVLDFRALGTGIVRDRRLAELQSMRLRSLNGGALLDTIPALGEALDCAADLGLDVMLEIKDGDADNEYLRDFLTCIGSLGHHPRVVVSSFNHHQLRAVRDLDSEIRTAAIVHERLLDPCGVALALECNVMALEHWFLHPDDADALHDVGVSVACFIQPPGWFAAGSWKAPGLPLDLDLLLGRGSIDILTADDVRWAVNYIEAYTAGESAALPENGAP